MATSLAARTALPDSARIGPGGHLEIGGCDTVELAQRFGAPLYVMDEALIRKNCREYLQAFQTRYPHVEVSFASKAFLCQAMARLVADEGMRIDVATGGELHVALAAGVDASRIKQTKSTSSSASCTAAIIRRFSS